MNIWFLLMLLIGLILAIINSCKKVTIPEIPVLIIFEVNDITTFRASCKGLNTNKNI